MPVDNPSWQQALPYVKELSPASDKGLGDERTVSLTPVFRQLCDGLGVVYVVDLGEELQYLQNRDLTAAGITETDLHEAALANLVHLVQQNGLRFRQQGDVMGLLLEGNFEASLLLLDALWDGGSLAEHAPNGFVAAVPARDVLLFCDAQSQAGLGVLRQVVPRGYAEFGHPISPHLFRRENGSWVRLPD
jgi:uncharacterized protein YtpQ (UPF0354 family)